MTNIRFKVQLLMEFALSREEMVIEIPWASREGVERVLERFLLCCDHFIISAMLTPHFHD